MSPIYKSLLHQMTATTATEFWNDSCAEDELIRALDHGAVGATSNPVIVANVLKKEFKTWHPRLLAIMAHHPAFSEIDLAWKIAEEVTTHGARLLYPTFEASQGLKGRLSIQVDPANYRNAAAMLAQAEHFYSLAPNLLSRRLRKPPGGGSTLPPRCVSRFRKPWLSLKRWNAD
jgi:transaldolase